MRSCAICYGRKVWQRRRTAASGSGRSTACWTRARPGSDPVSVWNGRLDREQLSDLARIEPEAPLTTSDRQISLTPIALRSAAFAAAWRVRIERVRPLTWIKGVGGQLGTIRRAFAYAVSGILLTVCLGISPCS